MYLIACEAPLSVKIGFTRGDPRFRLRQLQTGCPSKLVLLGWFPGSVEEERELHIELSSHRLSGEWFAVDEASSERLVAPLTLARINNSLVGYEVA